MPDVRGDRSRMVRRIGKCPFERMTDDPGPGISSAFPIPGGCPGTGETFRFEFLGVFRSRKGR